jgi:hypothetical protein
MKPISRPIAAVLTALALQIVMGNVKNVRVEIAGGSTPKFTVVYNRK